MSKRPENVLSLDELIMRGKKLGLVGLSPSEAQKKNPNYYRLVRESGHIDDIFVRTRAPRTNWREFSDAQLIKYAKENGLAGLTIPEATEVNSGYVKEVYNRQLTGKLFALKIEHANWRNMSNDELIVYGEKHGFKGLNSQQAVQKDKRYYSVVHRRGLDQQIFTIDAVDYTKRNWKTKTDDELLAYAKEAGYEGKSPTDIAQTDNAFYKVINQRGIADQILNQQLISERQVRMIVHKNASIHAVANLAGLGETLMDSARILAELWPDRFPDEDVAAKYLPKIIPKISDALHPVGFEGQVAFVYTPRGDSQEIAPGVMARIDPILVRIGIQQYQISFGKAPKETVAELAALRKRSDNANAVRVISAVESYYRSVLDFSIPGYGKLKNLV